MFDDEREVSECDGTIRSNIRILDQILESESSELDCFSLAHNFVFNENFCNKVGELKQIGEENNVLISTLKYVMEKNDNGLLTKKIQTFFKHLVIEYAELENANIHTLNQLVVEYANQFQIFYEANWYWSIENGCVFLDRRTFYHLCPRKSSV